MPLTLRPGNHYTPNGSSHREPDNTAWVICLSVQESIAAIVFQKFFLLNDDLL